MAKKTLGILLAVMLVALTVLGLAACNNQAEDKYTIVYLGDSIAEALIGPSPLSERDNYGYYAIVGKTNGFNYYNHSVSGHKTSTGIVSGDGAAYKGIHISHIGANPSTQPYCVFDLSNNNKGLMELMFKAEFMNATVVLEQSV